MKKLLKIYRSIIDLYMGRLLEPTIEGDIILYMNNLGMLKFWQLLKASRIVSSHGCFAIPIEQSKLKVLAMAPSGVTCHRMGHSRAGWNLCLYAGRMGGATSRGQNHLPQG